MGSPQRVRHDLATQQQQYTTVYRTVKKKVKSVKEEKQSLQHGMCLQLFLHMDTPLCMSATSHIYSDTGFFFVVIS